MQRTTIICSVIVLLAVAALAQAPQPIIGEAGNGSIPSEPGMYVQTAGGFNKILGQIVAFRAPAAYSHPNLPSESSQATKMSSCWDRTLRLS